MSALKHIPARRAGNARGEYIRALAHTWNGVQQQAEDMEEALDELAQEVDRVMDLALLELRFAELHQAQRTVDLICHYLLQVDRVDAAVAVLTGWSRNPHRTSV